MLERGAWLVAPHVLSQHNLPLCRHLHVSPGPLQVAQAAFQLVQPPSLARSDREAPAVASPGRQHVILPAEFSPDTIRRY